ncbi:MAG TPA: hypothetical protein ENI99_00520 [Sedimenticola sp.]|nr:hypothetical protein [Sedimenticola sp.]
MPRTTATGLILLLLMIMLSGCETLAQREKSKALTSTLKSYATTLRWSYLRRAYGFMRPEELRKTKIPPELENIKITGYEVMEKAAPAGEDSVIQVVRIDYVEQDRQQQKSLMDRQLWEFDKEAGRWYLISGIPEFSAAPRIRTSPLKK